MSVAALPPETKLVRDGVDSFRFILPRRILGKYRWIGLAPVIFGLGIGGFSYTWMAGTLHGISQLQGAQFIFPFMFGLIALPGLVAGTGLAILGLAILTERTYSEIVVSRQYLKSIEHFGLCRWSWKKPAAGLTSLSIGRGMGPDSEGDLGSVSVATEDGQGLMFAAGYPMALLQPIADNLARLLEQSRISRAFNPKVVNRDTDEDEAMIGHESTDDANAPESGSPGRSRPLVPTKARLKAEAVMPADTNITLLPQAQGMAIAIPPAGFKGASSIMILIGALFAGIPCAMLVAMLANPGSAKIGGYLFLGLFVLAGIALMLGGIHSARQRFMLAVAEDRLAIRRIGLFRTREQVLSRTGIIAIHIGPSNVSVNDVPIMELQIERSGDASTIGLMANRSHGEINWIAGLLRQTLHVGAEARFDQGMVADGAVNQPTDSKITIQRQGDAYAFAIPPLGLFKGAALGALMFSVIWLGMITFMAAMVVRSHESFGILLFLGIFIAIGLAMLVYAIKIGRQRVLLAVTPDMLAYQRTSPFGTSKRSFPRPEITAIGVGPSGASVNNKPIPELKVEIRQRGRIGLLQGHSTAELAWLAASLRSALQVGTISDD